MAYTAEWVSKLTVAIPDSNSVGEVEVRVLTVASGSTPVASTLLTYNLPEQEVRIGSGAAGQLYVIDPIIKKPL